MVLKRKTKKKKSSSMSSIRFDCVIHVQEIKPWPSSQSLKFFLLKWENGELNSGSFGPVSSSTWSDVGEGKIEFNEPIKLSTALSCQVSAKDEYQMSFQRNNLELHLYEVPENNYQVKVQFLGSFVMDLSEYGIIKNPVSLCLPISWKKGSKNSAQPVLFGKIEPFGEENHRSPLKESLTWKPPLNMDAKELIALMGEACSEEDFESVILTDDDVSSRSSLTLSFTALETPGSSPSQGGIKEVKRPMEQDMHLKSAGAGEGKIVDSMHDTVDNEHLDHLLMQNIRLEDASLRDSPHRNASHVELGSDKSRAYNQVEKSEISGADPIALFKINKEIDIVEDTHAYSKSLLTDKRRNNRGSKSFVAKAKSIFKEGDAESKIRQLEHKIELLEGELTATASLEASLYSVVAEHGRSINKFHAPARRLSRFYMHACKLWSQERKASAARSILSGLVFVAKASGADVPRLTFWLSNTVVLRAFISMESGDLPNAVAIESCIKPTKANTSQKLYPSKWNDSIHRGSKKRVSSSECSNDWGHPHTFTAALEKIEAWIFSRVAKFLWGQTLAPHMQSADGNEEQKNLSFHTKKSNGRKSSLGNQDQCTLSINIWKKAIRDACEKICHVRAAGHDCGCLSVLGKLIMEECISLLDTAMFNTILRESDKDIPTNPLSDLISNIHVLPVPVGKTCFGSGALLKNAIGDWSRLLTDLFGIDADDTPSQIEEDNREDAWRGFKPFHFLNALSDLLMLPKSLLFDRSIWKEICPTFGAHLLKRILHTFVPDEFCPEPIPKSLLDLLDSQASLEAKEGLIRKFPCEAVPINYTPPSAASINVGNIGSKSKLKRSGFLIVCKGQASDDELEELESLLSSIIIDTKQSSRSIVKDANKDKPVRFGLLHEV